MTRRLTLLICMLAVLLVALPVMAQDTVEDPLPNCPAFADQPENIRTSYYMGEGLAYLNSVQLNNAEFSFTCVIRVIDPSYVSAYMSRAAVYTRQRAYDLALEDYTKAIELDSSLMAAYNNRGVVYTATQEYDEAAADFDKVLELNPDYIPGYNNRSVIYAIQGEYDQAIELLQEAITRSGIDKVLAQYRDPNRPADAEPIKFDPIHARAYALLGVIYSARALDNYQDYLYLYNQSGQFPDQRIQASAGLLESQFTFEMRLDDGTWLLDADFSATGA